MAESLSRERYRLICKTRGSRIPVFQQHWWMETVCAGKEWDVAIAKDDNGNVLATLPYLFRQRFGMRYVLQPQLTQFSGPHIFYPDNISEARRTDFAHKATDLIIGQLEAMHLDYFMQRFPPEITDWLPFYWRGYKQTTRYTYRINDITNPQQVFENFDRSKERQRRIRRIADLYTVDTNIDAATFCKFHTAYWHSRGKSDILSSEFMQRVINTATARGQGLTLGLRDKEGRLVAAWFAVYDDQCAHALLSAKAPDAQSADVSALLIWRMIEHLSQFTKSFDFEGSMEQSLEYFYRSFGAKQIPILEVSRCRNPLFKLFLKVK